MLHLTTQTKVQRIDADIAETEFEQAIVLLHIENGEYYNFNSTGSDLWRALTEHKSVAELTRLLAAKYECTPEECQPDVITWLQQVASKGLLQVVAN